MSAPADEVNVVVVDHAEPINPLNQARILMPARDAGTELSHDRLLEVVRYESGIDPASFTSVSMKLGYMALQDFSQKSTPGDLRLKDQQVVVVTGRLEKCIATGMSGQTRVGVCYHSFVVDASNGALLVYSVDGP